MGNCVNNSLLWIGRSIRLPYATRLPFERAYLDSSSMRLARANEHAEHHRGEIDRVVDIAVGA
jgi:hypothetical protein